MRRNCWACKFAEGRYCTSGCGIGDPCAVCVWINETGGAEWVNGMPPKDADGCPGYEKRTGRKATR